MSRAIASAVSGLRPANDDARDDRLEGALAGLLRHLQRQGYRFVNPNRATHATVRQRRDAEAGDLRDIFGWVRPFAPDDLPAGFLADLMAADLVAENGDRLVSRVRVSSVGGLLFLHSALSAGRSAVFLGPDSYRYARFLRQTLQAAMPAPRALDIGVGAGVGALTLLRAGLARDVTGSDINPEALRLARVNAAHAGLPLRLIQASGVPSGAERFDLIVANPPFIAGSAGATYRDGGGLYGAALTLDWARASFAQLSDGGRCVFYTGAPVVGGTDLVREAMGDMTRKAGLRLAYDEIDPDIFGSSLKLDAYRDVERIAAVGAVISAC